MQERNFRFRTAGRVHIWNGVDCSGCESIDGQRYPRRHKDFGSTCLGLVHAEQVANQATAKETIFWCDGCLTKVS